MSLTEPSGLSLVPSGLQCRFGIGGQEKGPEMCFLFTSLFIAVVTFDAATVADLLLLVMHGVILFLHPSENPFVSPSIIKATAVLSG